MPTAQKIIEGALRNLRITKRGFTAATEDLNEGLEALNQLMDSLSVDMVPYRVRETFALAASQSSYSIGPSGDFNTIRPVKIDAITVRIDNVDYPINPYGLSEYNAINLKNITNIPDNFYYEASEPLGQIYFDFQPKTSYTIIIDSLKPLAQFATLGTNITMVQGYERAFKYLLAEELADEYDKDISSTLAKKIHEAKDLMLTAAISYRKPRLHVDTALLGAGRSYNIYKGE